MEIENASVEDLQAILKLQKLCYQETAERYQDYSIPPLTQTIESLRDDLKRCVVLKMAEGEHLIGSVRAFEKDATCHIGRVIVHPDHQNRGLGRKLMREIENRFPQARRFELFTGCRDERNLYFYGTLGYRIFREAAAEHLVYMEKVK